MVYFPLLESKLPWQCQEDRCQEDGCFLISKDPLHCYVGQAVKPLANIRCIDLHSCDRNIVLSFDDDSRSALVQQLFGPCGHAVYSYVLFTVVLMAGVVVLAVAAVTTGVQVRVGVGCCRAAAAGGQE